MMLQTPIQWAAVWLKTNKEEEEEYLTQLALLSLPLQSPHKEHQALKPVSVVAKLRKYVVMWHTRDFFPKANIVKAASVKR